MMRKVISSQRRRNWIFFQDGKVNNSGDSIVEVFKNTYTNKENKKEDPREYVSNR